MSKERFGKPFCLSQPNLQPGGGIVYYWPGKDIPEYERLFEKEKDRLAEYLLERAREHLRTFEVHTYSCYPHLQKGNNIAIHIGDGGRWIEIGRYIAGSMINFHNLDDYRDRIAGFNLASDALELLDEEILAPRIFKKGDEYTIQYYLPKGVSLLPSDKYPLLVDKKHITALFKIARLEEVLKIENEKDTQTFESKKGKIIVQNGVCKGEGFKKFEVISATWIIAQLLNACE